MAAALIRDACWDGTVQYGKAIEFFMQVKTTYRDKSHESEEGLLRRLLEPKLVVIDECDVRSESQWENNLLTYLIDKRYDSGVSSVLISNQKPDEFKAAMGASIVERIRETGCILECSWKSFRIKPA